MVPGIRPKGADLGDQQRVMGPKEALDAGASILVIGRPITAAPTRWKRPVRLPKAWAFPEVRSLNVRVA